MKRKRKEKLLKNARLPPQVLKWIYWYITPRKIHVIHVYLLLDMYVYIALGIHPLFKL